MGRKSCFYQPPFYVARPGAEVHAYPEQWATVGFEGLRVVLFVNLPQRFFGSAFELELHDVDVAVCLQHEVHTSLGGVIFHLGIESHQLEDNEKHVLVVQFAVADKFVGGVGKETLQAAEEGIGLSGFYLTYKLLYLERCLYLVEAGVERHQELDEPFFHFPVGEAEAVESEPWVVLLNREVSALEDDGQWVFVAIDAVQHVGVGFCMGHLLQVVVVAFQQFHQIGGGARLRTNSCRTPACRRC